MFFLSNTAYSVAPDGLKTDWSNVTELLHRKRKKKSRWNKMDSLCIYPTVFTEQMSFIFVLYLLICCFFVCFCFFFLSKPGPSYPVYTRFMFSSTIAIVKCSFSDFVFLFQDF